MNKSLKYIVTFTYGAPINPESKDILGNRKYQTTIIGYSKTGKAGWDMATKYADDNGHPKTQLWNDPISYSYDVRKV